MSIFSSTQQRISLEHPNEPLLICALNILANLFSFPSVSLLFVC